MKRSIKSVVAVLAALAILLCVVLPSFAQQAIYDENVIASVITASDLQGGDVPFERLETVMGLMKADGLTEADSLLIGGDYSKFLPNYATPEIIKVQDAFTSVFEGTDAGDVVCIQGNHDVRSSGFTKTGFYDMGAYCLYVINEDDFPWNQFLRLSNGVEKTANDVDTALNRMIEKGDNRPVFIVTHVPLHHTDRTLCGDNLYASYLFNVINKAAEKLDIVFLFGHNHSDNYDDYIGGAVNFMAPGEMIRVPLPDEMGEDCYTEETLNFTYTNCGYLGYSGNSDENGSTSMLTAAVIQIEENKLHFVRYSEEGFQWAKDVERKAPCATATERTETPAINNEFMWRFEVAMLDFFAKLFKLSV